MINIEHPIALSQATPDKGASEVASRGTSLSGAPVDSTALRRQVYGILHSLDHLRRSEAYWHVSRVVNQVRHLLHQV